MKIIPFCLVTAALGLAWCVGSASACDSGTVRDAAFHAKRDVHRLCLFSRADDPAAQAEFQRLERWAERQGPTLNLALERVNADDPAVVWGDYGIPSPPPELPVTALVGRFAAMRRTFVIDHWQPAPSDADLENLMTSPAREALKKAIAEKWAVILHCPAAQDAVDLQPVFDAVAAKWEKEQSPGVTVVRLDRSSPQERVTLAFAGIEPGGPDWAGVVFGRGKLLAPPLLGEEISESGLNELIASLAVQCTCLQDALTIGLDMPLVWEPELDAKFASLVAQPLGYTEITFAEQAEALAQEVPDPAQNTLWVAAGVTSALAGLAVLAAGLMVWRSRRWS
jgi:hypothetical protein